jgi:hypothetical protein
MSQRLKRLIGAALLGLALVLGLHQSVRSHAAAAPAQQIAGDPAGGSGGGGGG